MELEELDIWTIGKAQYVPMAEAGRYLKMKMSDLEGQIAAGRLELFKYQERWFIELEALKAYAEKRKSKVTGWDRIEEWRKQGRRENPSG